MAKLSGANSSRLPCGASGTDMLLIVHLGKGIGIGLGRGDSLTMCLMEVYSSSAKYLGPSVPWSSWVVLQTVAFNRKKTAIVRGVVPGRVTCRVF